MIKRRAVAALVVACLGRPAWAAPSAIEAARIERLIDHVAAQKKMAFIRNGTAYSCKEAALFLRGKFEKMGEHVSTAAQFIDQIASRSSTTGQPYLIRFPDGRTMPAGQFLAQELQRMDRPS
jgi:hypothetical protein